MATIRTVFSLDIRRPGARYTREQVAEMLVDAARKLREFPRSARVMSAPVVDGELRPAGTWILRDPEED